VRPLPRYRNVCPVAHWIPPTTLIDANKQFLFHMYHKGTQTPYEIFL